MRYLCFFPLVCEKAIDRAFIMEYDPSCVAKTAMPLATISVTSAISIIFVQL